MTTLTIPAEVAAIPRPDWATHDYGWERDGGDGSFTRTLYRPCGETIKIMQGQSWVPGKGAVWHELEIMGMDSVMGLSAGDGTSLADEARAFAAEFLEAARVCDEKGL